jgi:predicted nucleic acid-binding protein
MGRNIQFADLAVARYDHVALADRTWELRHNLTAYDATFVALAELLDVPLVTCDAPLDDAPGNRAVIELYEGAGG